MLAAFGRGNDVKRRTFVMMVLLALGVSAGTATQPNTAEAANGYEQWTSDWSDGCSYYWDGFQYTQAACPRTDGGFDFYGAYQGQWVYAYSAGLYTNGQGWFLFSDGNWIVANANGSIASSSFVSSTSSSGGSFIDWSNPRIQKLMEDPATAAALIKLQETANEGVNIAIAGF